MIKVCLKCEKEREFIYYDGCLGYESFVCAVCGWDINDIPKELKGGIKEDGNN